MFFCSVEGIEWWERKSEEKANHSSRKKSKSLSNSITVFFISQYYRRRISSSAPSSPSFMFVWTIGNTPRISEFFNRLSSLWKLCAFENFLVAFPPTSQTTHTHYILYDTQTHIISQHFQFVYIINLFFFFRFLSSEKAGVCITGKKKPS